MVELELVVDLTGDVLKRLALNNDLSSGDDHTRPLRDNDCTNLCQQFNVALI